MAVPMKSTSASASLAPCTLCVALSCCCVTSSWLEIFHPTERPEWGWGDNVIERLSRPVASFFPFDPARVHVKSSSVASVGCCVAVLMGVVGVAGGMM